MGADPAEARKSCERRSDREWRDGLCVIREGGVSGGPQVGGDHGGPSTGEPIDLHATRGETSQTIAHGMAIRPITMAPSATNLPLTYRIADDGGCPGLISVSDLTIIGSIDYSDRTIAPESLPRTCVVKVIGEGPGIVTAPLAITIRIEPGLYSRCDVSRRSLEPDPEVEAVLGKLRASDCEEGAKKLESARELDFRCTGLGFGETARSEVPLRALDLLRTAASLEKLCVRSSVLKSVIGIASLQNLASLTISGDDIKSGPTILDLAEIMKITTLTDLNLWGVRGLDLADIGHLADLRALDLSFNMIPDIAPLSALIRLEALFLANNRIEDISAIGGLANLSQFSILGNPLMEPGARRGITCPVDARSAIIAEFCRQ